MAPAKATGWVWLKEIGPIYAHLVDIPDGQNPMEGNVTLGSPQSSRSRETLWRQHALVLGRIATCVSCDYGEWCLISRWGLLPGPTRYCWAGPGSCQRHPQRCLLYTLHRSPWKFCSAWPRTHSTSLRLQKSRGQGGGGPKHTKPRESPSQFPGHKLQLCLRHT